MRRHALAFGLVTGWLSVCLPAQAGRGEQPVRPLTDQDYREIKALVQRYVLGWDNVAPDDGGALVGQTFTPDVVFLNAGGVRAGQKAVADSAARSKPGLQHWTSSLLIDPAPGGAVGWSYVLLVTVDADGSHPRITGGGVYRDVYEKTPAGWLIKRRFYDAVTDGLPPSWPWDTRVRAWEDTPPVRALKYDQVHFGVAEPERAAEWYRTHFGGERIQEPVDPRVMLGTTRLIFLKVDHPLPSAGSVLDHVAFSVADVDATIKALEAGGARVVEPAHDDPRFFRSGMVDDPWGIRVEVLHDPDATGFHHVHLRVPDPERLMQRYVNSFGGETSRLRGTPGIRYGAFGNWVLVDTGHGAPSAGHAIDHIGWDTPDVRETYTRLKGLNARFLNEPQRMGKGGAFFVEGPEGDKLEIVQR